MAFNRESLFIANRVYWEQQQLDSLCAMHALNSLLQYPYWNAVSLALIARDIDDMENTISRVRQSENVDDKGNFSIQVIKNALNSKNLDINYLKKEIDYESNDGIICHYYNHWVAIRKLHGSWFDLNSLGPGPKLIGNLYLNEIINNYKYQGFTILYITGNFPANPEYTDLNKFQYVFSIDDIKNNRIKFVEASNEEEKQIQMAIRESQKNLNNGRGDDYEMQAALEISKRAAEEEEMIRKAIEASCRDQQKGYEDNPREVEILIDRWESDSLGEDEQIRMAIEISKLEVNANPDFFQ